MRVLTIDPDYPVPGNLGYYPAQTDVEQRILNNETAAYFAKAEADRLEKLAYDPDKEQVDYPEMRAALVLERRFQLRFRRPEQAERGGIDFIDDRGTTWDLIGTSADEAMDYRGFIVALKEKIADTRVGKVGMDVGMMGEENFRKVMIHIRSLSVRKQSKVVLIIGKTVVGSDR